MRLKDKVTLITGASSGIGYQTALKYAEEGAIVYALARRAEKLNDLVEVSKELEGEITPVSGDVSKEEDIKNIVSKVIDKHGRIDVLINNAGIIDDYKGLETVTDEIWDSVMNINVTGLMKMSRAVLPHMKENKKGVILNTASVGGLNGMRGGIAYVASKHAVVGMTKSIGYTYSDFGIRCVAIAPGSIGTEIGTKVKEPDMFVLDKLMAGNKIYPIVGEPDDIANVYAFLATDDAKFINGTTIIVDGGWTAY